MNPLQHKPKTIVRDIDVDATDPLALTYNKRYSQRIVCTNCNDTFKVWILFGKPKTECKPITCPNCGCETKLV